LPEEYRWVEGVFNWNMPRVGKLRCLKLLNDTGLAIPFVEANVYEFDQYEDVPEDWMSWLWRTERGSRGQDIIMQNTRQPANTGLTEWHTFITQYIPKVAEYRVHVFGDKVLQVTRKKPADPSVIAWNTGNDVVQHRIKNQIQIETIGNVGMAAMDCMGDRNEHLFGAVDVIMDEFGSLYVLEINSAPSLTVESRVNAYAQEVLALAGVEHTFETEEDDG